VGHWPVGQEQYGASYFRLASKIRTTWGHRILDWPVGQEHHGTSYVRLSSQIRTTWGHHISDWPVRQEQYWASYFRIWGHCISDYRYVKPSPGFSHVFLYSL